MKTIRTLGNRFNLVSGAALAALLAFSGQASAALLFKFTLDSLTLEMEESLETLANGIPVSPTTPQDFLESTVTHSEELAAPLTTQDNGLVAIVNAKAQTEFGSNKAMGLARAFTNTEHEGFQRVTATSEWRAGFTVNAPAGQIVPITFNASAEGEGYGKFLFAGTYLLSVARAGNLQDFAGEDQFGVLCLLECVTNPDEDPGYNGFRSEAQTFTLNLVGGASYQISSLLQAGAQSTTIDAPVSCDPGSGNPANCTLDGLDAFGTATFGDILVPEGVSLEFTAPGFTVSTVPLPAGVWLFASAAIAGGRFVRRKSTAA